MKKTELSKKEIKAKAKKALKITSEQNDKKPFLIQTTFGLGGTTPLALKMDGGGIYWDLKLNINQILDRSFYKYNIRLSINEDPFNRKIEEAERKISEIGSESHLPGMEDKGEIKSQMERIKDTKIELEQLIKSTDIIEFYATVISIKYSGVVTVVEFNIPADIIALLNKNRFFFSQYKIELEPIFGNPEDNK
jgi:hypothetical protein